MSLRERSAEGEGVKVAEEEQQVAHATPDHFAPVDVAQEEVETSLPLSNQEITVSVDGVVSQSEDVAQSDTIHQDTPTPVQAATGSEETGTETNSEEQLVEQERAPEEETAVA